MDCVDVKEAILRGEALSWEAAQHATECPVCSLVVRADEDGARSDALFSEIHAAIERDRGVRAWLRSRSTPTRVVMIAAASLGVAGLVGMSLPRGHFAPVPVLAVAAAMAALAVALVFALWLELRPLQSPEVSPRRILICAALGLAIPIVAAFIPVPSAARFERYAEFTPCQAGLGCFVIGAVTGLAVIALVRLFDRKERISTPGALLLATAGGIAGNLALELHCPITSPSHLVIGHATVGVALLAFVVLYGLLPRRRTA